MARALDDAAADRQPPRLELRQSRYDSVVSHGVRQYRRVIGGLRNPGCDMGPGDEIATLRVWEEGGRWHHSGSSGPWPGDIPRYTITCPQGPAELVLMGALGFFVTDFNNDQVAANGRSFGGNHTSSAGPGITTRHQYSFRCAAGC